MVIKEMLTCLRQDRLKPVAVGLKPDLRENTCAIIWSMTKRSPLRASEPGQDFRRVALHGGHRLREGRGDGDEEEVADARLGEIGQPADAVVRGTHHHVAVDDVLERLVVAAGGGSGGGGRWPLVAFGPG